MPTFASVARVKRIAISMIRRLVGTGKLRLAPAAGFDGIRVMTSKMAVSIVEELFIVQFSTIVARRMLPVALDQMYINICMVGSRGMLPVQNIEFVIEV